MTQPLVGSLSLQSSRQAGCIPERRVISCQARETRSEAVLCSCALQKDASFEPLPANTGRMRSEGSFMQCSHIGEEQESLNNLPPLPSCPANAFHG